MKTFFGTVCLTLAVVAAAPLTAQEPLSPIAIPDQRVFSPVPEAHSLPPSADVDFGEPYIPDSQPFHGEIVQGPVYVDSAPIPLFTKVRYVDKREMHPCAVTKIVQVNNPCSSKHGCTSCNDCVFIEICVPPCAREDVVCRRDGDRVRYDYGKYKVDIRVRRGYIVVDYQK
ncbi:MAG: hypothetical protein R3C49_01845 [Planctomycetaceae bacterium]